MELVLNGPDVQPLEFEKDLLVVVACEQAAHAPRVCALLKRVGQNVPEAGRLVYSWWTFATLNSPPLRQLAAREAAGADMVLVAANEGPGLPEAVKDWIRLWTAAGQSPQRSRVLVAFLEPDQTNRAARAVFSELKDLAQLGWLNFIANGEEVRLDLPGVSATVRHMVGQRDQGAQAPMPDGWRRESLKKPRIAQESPHHGT